MAHQSEDWTESPYRGLKSEKAPSRGTYATLETDSPIAAALFETNGPDGRKRFSVWLMVASPPSYLHELDRWLRARCVCRLVTKKSSRFDTLVQTMSEHYSDQSCDGMQSSVLYLSESLKIAAVVRKDFDNGGKVAHVDLSLRGKQDYPFELNGSLQIPAELEDSSLPLEAPNSNDDHIKSEDSVTEEDHIEGDGLQYALQGLVDKYAATVELRSTLPSPTTINPSESSGIANSSFGGKPATNGSNPLARPKSPTSGHQTNSFVDVNLVVGSTNSFERTGSVTSRLSQTPSISDQQCSDRHETTFSDDPSATTATSIGRGYFGSPEFASDFEPSEENWPLINL